MPNLHRQVVSASMAVLFSLGCLTTYARGQAAQTATQPLSLRAALVLTPEFCATKSKKGTWMINQETFPVGKTACAEFEPILKTAFSSMTKVEDASAVGDAQVILTPRFVDVGASQRMLAYGDRELTVVVEWTARDKSGKLVWLETIQGTGKKHMGNAFTHGSNVKHIVEEAERDVAQQAVAKMTASPEMARLAAGGTQTVQ
jgi:hypothetical protein